MGILVLDLHIGKENVKETVKIVDNLRMHDNTTMIRLFSPEFSYGNLQKYRGIVLSGFDKQRVLTSPKGQILKEYLKKLTEEGIYVLAICGGHHLLGVNHGYEYERVNPQFGWPPIRFTKLGELSPLFKGFGSTIRPFQFHYNGFRDMEKGKVLAKDENCIQAVQYGPFEFGIQSHPEESPQTGLDYLRYAYEKASDAERDAMEKAGIQQAMSPESVPKDYEEWKIFKNFVDMTSQNQR